MKKGFIIANQNEEFVAGVKFGDGFHSVAWADKPGSAVLVLLILHGSKF